MEWSLPWLFYDPGEKKAKPKRAPPAVETLLERRLLCRSCRRLVTTQDLRIEVSGAHEHTCTNPHGLSFHIGCFAGAEGCKAIGLPTTDHTWFAGYTWMIGLCASCEQHLGWYFQSSTDSFHGLILDRLISGSER